MLASIPARTLNPIRSRRGIPRFSLFGKCSKRRGIEFDLKEATWNGRGVARPWGIELHYPGQSKGDPAGAAFDRINNDLGYLPGNVVIVSYWVNTRKGDATPAQLRAIADFYSRPDSACGDAVPPHAEMLAASRRSAKHQRIKFDIKETDLEWPRHCPVLKIELRYPPRSKGDPALATIGRINNGLGYIPGNVVIVSRWVNTRKGDATPAQY
jgi:hypothetical protein